MVRVTPELARRLSERMRGPWGPGPRLLDVLALAAILGSVAYLAAVWSRLPAEVPTHLDATGLPDRHGPVWTLLILPGAQVVVYVLLGLAPRLPVGLWNVPMAVTDANLERQATLMTLFLRGLRTGIIVLLGLAAVLKVRLALGLADAVSPWTSYVIGLGIAGLIAWVLISLVRLNRG